jgi:hypothetical protein
MSDSGCACNAGPTRSTPWGWVSIVACFGLLVGRRNPRRGSPPIQPPPQLVRTRSLPFPAARLNRLAMQPASSSTRIVWSLR